MTLTFKEAFARYEHPFDFIIETITAIRKLKADFNLGSKKIENAIIVVKNNEYKLVAIMQSVENIKNLCKIETLSINYFDDENPDNDLYLKF